MKGERWVLLAHITAFVVAGGDSCGGNVGVVVVMMASSPLFLSPR